MKKLILLTGLCIFILTGCGAGATKTMSCTYKTVGTNLTTNMIYNIDYQGKEVKKVRVTYDYHQEPVNTTNDQNEEMDGVGTGTDGTTNDTQIDNDGIIDGIVGSAIDTIINGVTDTILDISGIRSRHTTVQNTYSNMPGFSVQNTTDNTDNDYRVTYIIDFDMMDDDQIDTLNFSRNIDILSDNYRTLGFTCVE